MHDQFLSSPQNSFLSRSDELSALLCQSDYKVQYVVVTNTQEFVDITCLAVVLTKSLCLFSTLQQEKMTWMIYTEQLITLQATAVFFIG